MAPGDRAPPAGRPRSGCDRNPRAPALPRDGPGYTLRPVSGKLPQTYTLHTVALFVVLTIAMVMFLRHSWG